MMSASHTTLFATIIVIFYGKSIASRPNIIFILADDLDAELGSPLVMQKTKRLLQDEGVTFTNAFTTSPMCCPSRSSILTGRYAHNHHVNSNNRNCSGPGWINGPEKESFGKLMQDAGYTTAYFGKYLNNYDGSRIPPGWDHWSGLIGNSRFYNYSLNINGKIVRHKNNYERDYSTNVFANASTEYFENITKGSTPPPVMMVVSMAAPHGPEDAALPYTKSFKGVKAPRTPAYNLTCLDKHWIVRIQPGMDQVRVDYTDILHRKRLQTLLSLDDAIEKIYLMLVRTGQLNNTYLIFSSDHGYHLGQFNLVKGKSNPYETDIKIPLYMRGPNIPQGEKVSAIALNIDLAPTFLDIARFNPPQFLDGASLMDHASGDVINRVKRKVQKPVWRDTFLVERNKSPPNVKKNKAQQDNSTIKTLISESDRQVEKMCVKEGFPKPPCTPEKKMICYKKDDEWVLERCRLPEEKNCICKVNTKMSSTNYMTEPNETGKVEDEMGSFLLQLERQFKKLKRRIKRHGVKYLIKISSKPQKPTIVPYYAQENTTNAQVVSVEKKIQRSKERLEYWKNKRQRMSKLGEYRKLAQALVKEINNSVKGNLKNNTCECKVDASLFKNKKAKKKKKWSGKNMKCFDMDKHHWKTPPYWTGPSFISCTNSPNSSYWCLRTINSTHNFLYCEFITGFKEFFDINNDPYQLTNTVSLVSNGTLLDLHRQLNHMRSCRGAENCLLQAGESLNDSWDMLRKWKRYERKKRQGIYVRSGYDFEASETE